MCESMYQDLLATEVYWNRWGSHLANFFRLFSWRLLSLNCFLCLFLLPLLARLPLAFDDWTQHRLLAT